MCADVIIIGAGMAGTAAATALAKAGYDVALIDTHAAFPSEFRAEKIGSSVISQFERVGLGAVLHANVSVARDVWIARFDKFFGTSPEVEYSFHYTKLVNGLRAALPSNVRIAIGRVADIETSADRQCVTLNDGSQIEGRLLVLATGLGDALKNKVGIKRTRVSRTHSLSFGFSFATPKSAFRFPSFVYYGDVMKSRIAYFTIFPVEDGMRANLFVYRTVEEAWTKRFREAPVETLMQDMPGLADLCPALEIKGPIAMRPIDLTEAVDYRRDGVVLIGDAFGTCCPIIGMGISKVLTDVEVLCTRHIPNWLASEGMGAEKIGAFYDDEVKRACDQKARLSSVYARAIGTDPGLVWAARRLRNKTARHAIYALNMLRRAVFNRSRGRAFSASQAVQSSLHEAP